MEGDLKILIQDQFKFDVFFFMAGKNWINRCLADPYENAARHAGHTRDEVGAVGVFEEQLQPLVHQPCRPHADSRPHHLQWG